jgi:hypothetical protein
MEHKSHTALYSLVQHQSYRVRQKKLTVFKSRYTENRQVFLPHPVYPTLPPREEICISFVRVDKPASSSAKERNVYVSLSRPACLASLVCPLRNLRSSRVAIINCINTWRPNLHSASQKKTVIISLYIVGICNRHGVFFVGVTNWKCKIPVHVSLRRFNESDIKKNYFPSPSGLSGGSTRCSPWGTNRIYMGAK